MEFLFGWLVGVGFVFYIPAAPLKSSSSSLVFMLNSDTCKPFPDSTHLSFNLGLLLLWMYGLRFRGMFTAEVQDDKHQFVLGEWKTTNLRPALEILLKRQRQQQASIDCSKE